MRIAQTVRDVRAARDRLTGRVGLVPTMGALHAGHEALLARARSGCDSVIASLFVNPAQFGPLEDFAAYPRDRHRDRAIFEACGVDVLFEPAVEEIYPPGESTRVDPGPIARVLEGASRPGHFIGVATVVAKLFAITRPSVAYFGRKDAQQLVIVQRLARDLRLGIEIEPVNTVRDARGLALSSRNVNLSPKHRTAAGALYKALLTAKSAWTNGQRSGQALRKAMRDVLDHEEAIETDYVSAAHPETLEELDDVPGPVLLSLAARIAGTRLIDNITLPDPD